MVLKSNAKINLTLKVNSRVKIIYMRFNPFFVLLI